MYDRVIEEYLAGGTLGEISGQALLDAFDSALAACEGQDFDSAGRALGELRGSLDFERSPAAALDLLRVYLQCHDLARLGQFGDAQNLLVTVRVAWHQTLTNPAQEAG